MKKIFNTLEYIFNMIYWFLYILLIVFMIYILSTEDLSNYQIVVLLMLAFAGVKD